MRKKCRASRRFQARAEEYDVDDSDAHGSDGMEDDELDADDFI